MWQGRIDCGNVVGDNERQGKGFPSLIESYAYIPWQIAASTSVSTAHICHIRVRRRVVSRLGVAGERAVGSRDSKNRKRCRSLPRERAGRRHPRVRDSSVHREERIPGAILFLVDATLSRVLRVQWLRLSEEHTSLILSVWSSCRRRTRTLTQTYL